MPKKISLSIILTLSIATFMVFAGSEAGAQCDPSTNALDYSLTCGEQGNYFVSIVEPFPSIAPCSDNPSENCSTYTWQVGPGTASHFNLLVDALFEDKIVLSSGDPIDCTGAGDTSQGADNHAKFLTWNCLIKFENTQNVSLTLRGEFSSAPTDWFVKQSSDSIYGDFGKTQGPAESCEEQENYFTTQDIKKVVQEFDDLSGNGPQEYAVCLKAVKNNSKCYNEFYYACPPADGECNDVADADWCPATQQPFEDKLVTQVYGEWACSNVIYVPDDAAYYICPVAGGAATCQSQTLAQTNTGGGFLNPCTPPSIEANFGGYPYCINYSY